MIFEANKFRVLKLLFLGFIPFFVGCKKNSSKFNESQVFRYNEYSNITSLDPAFAKNQSNIWAVNQLFNGLIQLDESLHTKLDIAKKWTISKDGKTYKFTLRNDVKFHKNKLFGKNKTRVVIAKDFEYSFNRLLDKNVASPGSWVLQNVADFKAENDTIFTIHLKRTFPPFLGLLTMKYCSVVPKEAIDFLEANLEQIQ